MPVRHARLSDAREIAEVQVASWKSAYRGLIADSLLDNLQVAARQQRWDTILADSSSHVFVIEQNGHILGFIATKVNADEDADAKKMGEIGAVYLAPNEWRKGYGRQLVDAAIASLREQGFAEVTLWVLRNNKRAIEFYESLGFRPDGATKVDVRENDVQLHEVRYRRALGAS